eukprot:689881_1
MTNSCKAKPISSTLYHSIFIFNLFHIASSSWISTDSVLPTADGDFVIGYNPYNETIHLLGGYNLKQQHMEYDINAQSIVDHDSTWLPNNVFSYSQYYRQLNDVIYIKSAVKFGISTFNVKTNTFIPSYTDYVNGGSVQIIYPCVATTEGYVFIAGGRYHTSSSIWVTTTDVHVYDLAGDQWIQNIPSMQKPREEHSCIIHPDTNELHVFGGFFGENNQNTQFLSSIEKINIDDITHKTWTSVGDLTQALSTTTAVSYRNMIFIIGGWLASGSATNIVHTVDVSTDTIAVFTDLLPVNLCESSAIVVGDMLYVFGGGGDSDYYKTLLTYDLQTLNLGTSNPSAIPTAIPTATTANPTAVPTAIPTAKPTANPTAKPTANPTTKPTANPTAKPTQIPTARPTTTEPNPTASGTPTHKPSSIPTQVTEQPSSDSIYAQQPALNPVMMTTYSGQTSADSITTQEHKNRLADPEVGADNVARTLLIIAGIIICILALVLVYVLHYFCRETKMEKRMGDKTGIVTTSTNINRINSQSMVESVPWNQSTIVQTPTQGYETNVTPMSTQCNEPGVNGEGEGGRTDQGVTLSVADGDECNNDGDILQSVNETAGYVDAMSDEFEHPGENHHGEGKNVVELAIAYEGGNNNASDEFWVYGDGKDSNAHVTIGNNMEEEDIAPDEFIVSGDDDMITKF